MTKKKGYKVPGKKIIEIRNDAEYIKNLFNLGKKVNMVKIIEFVLPTFLPDFEYVVLPEKTMGNDEARTYPDKYLMEMRSDVYEALTNGERRAQFTMAHELGHLVMHQKLAIMSAISQELMQNMKYTKIRNGKQIPLQQNF